MLVRSVHPGSGRIAALCHETGNDAVEHDAVVKAVIRQLGDARDVLRREIAAQLDHDVAAIKGERQGFGKIGHHGLLENGGCAALAVPPPTGKQGDWLCCGAALDRAHSDREHRDREEVRR